MRLASWLNLLEIRIIFIVLITQRFGLSYHRSLQVSDPKGYDPNMIGNLLGRKLAREVKADEPISENDISKD